MVVLTSYWRTLFENPDLTEVGTCCDCCHCSHCCHCCHCCHYCRSRIAHPPVHAGMLPAGHRHPQCHAGATVHSCGEHAVHCEHGSGAAVVCDVCFYQGNFLPLTSPLLLSSYLPPLLLASNFFVFRIISGALVAKPSSWA